jgi:hypothetical protein
MASLEAWLMEFVMTQTSAWTARARNVVHVPDQCMRHWVARAAACVLAAVVSVPAFAAFHLFRIDQVYSNADGTVQYVVMRESTGSNNENLWAGNPFTTTSAAGTQQFTFPANLPSSATASKSVLIATSGFAALGLVAPDYTIPNGFIPRTGGTLNYANVDTIALPALPSDGATAIDRNGMPVPATPKNFAGNSATLSAAPPPAATLDLDQHGLTGSWFDAAESGQGIEVEFYPDLVAPGSSLVSGAWFTFDSGAPGGADRQRWYVFNGTGTRGATTIPITIGQNVGGNFAAGPVTTATVVGSGTLAFGDCNTGTLRYAFTDGSGRSGTIPISRITPNVTCVITGAAPGNADFSLSGNWFDPATSGQGFVFEVNPLAPVVFFAWYTYSPTGQMAGAAGQRWYTGQGAFTPGSRTIALTLGETTGGVFDQATPPGQKTVAVGTATVTFMTCTSAQLAYNFTGGTSTGRSGTIMLSRVGPVPPGCGTAQSATTMPPPGMGYPPGGYGPP